MKFYPFIIFLFIFIFGCQRNINTVSTTYYENNNVFPISEYKLETLRDSVLFVIPDSADKYIIKQLSLFDNTTYYFLVFQTHSDRKYVIADINKNFSFIDDKIYSAKELSISDISNYSFKDINCLPTIRLFDKQGVFFRDIKLCVTNTGMSYTDSLDNILYLTVYISGYREVIINKDRKKYRALFWNTSLNKQYTTENTIILLQNAGSTMNAISSSNTQRNFYDSIFIDNYVFVFDSISLNGEKIRYSISHNLDNITWGIDSGNYTKNITIEDINGINQLLYSEEKSYSLIDFWGTWCAPCIKLFPKLDSMYHSYNADVQFIGVACYSDLNDVKLSNDLHKKGWINFIQTKENQPLIEKYKISTFPSFLLIDKNGKIIFKGAGKEDLEKIDIYLQQHIQNER